MTPEKRVQSAIEKYLSELEKVEPLFYERRQAGGFSYKKGIPDIYFVYYGQHVEVEVKKPGGTLSIMQEKFQEKCKKKHILWICAESTDDVEKAISQIKQRMLSNKII